MSCYVKFPIASSKVEGADHYLLGLCINLFRLQIRLSHMCETDGTAQVRGNKVKNAQMLAGGAKNHEVKVPW